ncbi:MAG TPA: acyl-CoA dehydrogenase family protein [Trebonia sp.]|jgi:acyl-CoA dehydrogenase
MSSPLEALADQDLLSMLDTVFGRQAASEPGPGGLDAEFWGTLESLGLTRLTQPEARGGSGAGWPEVTALLAAAARHAVPVPIAEHDLLAGWLLTATGLAETDLPADAGVARLTAAGPGTPPSRLCTAAVLDAGGRARGVGWAVQADILAVLWPADGQWHAAVLPAGDARVAADDGQRAEPRGSVAVDIAALAPHPVPARFPRQFRLRGALARTIQMAAAMETVVNLCARHVSERAQFGRPLAKFQAVRDLVAEAAAQSALASAATASAVAAMSGAEARSGEAGGSGDEDTDLDAAEFAVAVARSAASHAAAAVIRDAHQVHGAIGTTAEHQLHRYSGPIGLWRTEFGSVRSWDEYVTRAAVTAGGEGLWPLLTRGSSPRCSTGASASSPRT